MRNAPMIDEINLRNVERITATASSIIGSQVAITLTIKGADGQEFEAALWLPRREQAYARELATAINRTANNWGHLTTDEQIELLDATEEEMA